MSTYQELKGLKIKYLSSDTSGDRIKEGEVFYNSADFNIKSFVSTAAWNSSGSLGTARYKMASAPGAPATAGIIFSGQQPGSGSPNTTNLTEEYNGTGFSVGGNLNTSRRGANGFGTQTTAVCVGGFDGGPAELADVEEYNGSTWTEVNNTPNTRRLGAGCGTLTAGITFGGLSNGADTFEYDGTNWTSGGSLNTGRRELAGFGTQTAALGAGGYATNASVEEYNGTSWTEVNDIGTGRYGAGGGGIQTNGLIFGGHDGSVTGKTETYDGTSFSETSDMATSRTNLGGFGASQSSAVASGGGAPPGRQSATEEFTISLTATTGAAFASGGNTVNARRNAGCMGTQTASLYAGGFGPPYLNYSEEYNGTAWTEGNNTTIARECSTSGFGTQTAGAIAGGGAPDNITSPYGGYSNSTDEYNGTSWSEGGDINSHRLGMATCGTQTAGFGAGGYQGANHPDSPPSNTAKCEQYDGTSWTEVADLNTARSSMAHFGTQTASIACRKNTNPTESWDGSSWTNLSNSPIVFDGGNHGGGTQTAGITYGPRPYSLTELWDGTTWVTGVRYSTSRGGNCAGDASSGLLVGGYTGTANTNATEEYTGETTAARAVKTVDFD